MVWGCFAGERVGDLYHVHGILNQHGYHSMAYCRDTPFHQVYSWLGLQPFSNNTTTPKHTSNLCKNYLKKKENDGHLKIMTWPPQSPDLNPIELVWDKLDRRAKAKQPTSDVYLWKLLQESWKNILGDYLVKLVNRMPRICETVIKAKGEPDFEESKI